MLSLSKLTVPTLDNQEQQVVVFKHKPPQDGQKPKALFYIAGLGGTSLLALDLLETMLPAFDTVLGFDLRGFGVNQELAPKTPQEQLKEVMTGAYYTVQDLGLESHQFHLVGLSLGGVMATHWATDPNWPAPWQSLLLLAPGYAGHPSSFTLPYILGNAVPGLLGLKKKLKLPYGRTDLTQNPRYLDEESYQEHIQALGLEKAYTSQMPIPYMLQIPGFGKSGLAAAKKLWVPTVVVIPGQDKVCDPRLMYQAYEQLPAETPKQLVELPGVKHDIPLEEVAPQLGEGFVSWLRQHNLL